MRRQGLSRSTSLCGAIATAFVGQWAQAQVSPADNPGPSEASTIERLERLQRQLDEQKQEIERLRRLVSPQQGRPTGAAQTPASEGASAGDAAGEAQRAV